MKGQIDNSIPPLKLLSKTVPQTTANTFQSLSPKLGRFLQLQLDHLAALPQIKWIQATIRVPESPDQPHVFQASQTLFPHPPNAYQYLQSEQWLARAASPLALNPIHSGRIDSGFYYCVFTEPDQQPQYLLLWVEGPLSHVCRQLIRRTAACIRDALEECQQQQQQQQSIQRLEGIVQRVGHQLQHPLSLISLYAHTLGRSLSEGQALEQISVIEQTAQGLSQTLAELMQCAKRRDLKMSSQDLRTLVHKTLEDFQGWITEKKLNIVCSEESLDVTVDPLHLKQAISNLLSNAIHFSPDGAEVRIQWHLRHGQVRLMVTDEGPGLSPDDLKQLFQPFYTNRTGGTGLGLAITQKAVFDHGGKLWASNTPGKGATFTIGLPNVISSTIRREEHTAC